MTKEIPKPGIRLKTTWHINPKVELGVISLVKGTERSMLLLERKDGNIEVPIHLLYKTDEGYVLLSTEGRECVKYVVTTEIPQWLIDKQQQHVDEQR